MTRKPRTTFSPEFKREAVRLLAGDWGPGDWRQSKNSKTIKNDEVE